MSETGLQSYRRDDGTYHFPPEFGGSIEAVYDWAIQNAPLDMAVVGNVPVVELGAICASLRDTWNTPRRWSRRIPSASSSAAGTDPSGVLGGTPTESTVKVALDEIEHQITDRCKSKVNPVGWRCDDEKIAYPM